MRSDYELPRTTTNDACFAAVAVASAAITCTGSCVSIMLCQPGKNTSTIQNLTGSTTGATPNTGTTEGSHLCQAIKERHRGQPALSNRRRRGTAAACSGLNQQKCPWECWQFCENRFQKPIWRLEKSVPSCGTIISNKSAIFRQRYSSTILCSVLWCT